MKKFLSFFLALLLALFVVNAPPCLASDIKVLCYHDVSSAPDAEKDPFAVSPALLREHIKHLKDDGYTFISIDDYQNIMNGRTPAPAKAVLLTFDDGYQSFYTEIFPILKEEKIPAVMALIGSWMDGVKPSGVGPIVNWQQVREMQNSGLVTIGSHSYDMHRWTPINPYGDKGIPAESRLYLNGRYETEEGFISRIRFDLGRAQRQFEAQLGQKARVMVWPYGGSNKLSEKLALESGFEINLLLDAASNEITPLNAQTAKRGLIVDRPDIKELDRLLALKDGANKPLRMAQVDIDKLYDEKSAKNTEKNIDALIQRLHASGVRTVALQTFADLDGSGDIREVYFYSRSAPLRVDIFSHVVSRLYHEGVQTYAWVTTIANPWMIAGRPEAAMAAIPANKAGWYKRVSPFDQENKRKIIEMFKDIVVYAPVAGVLFQDDMYMNDFEDFSQPAKDAYRNKFGRELTPDVRNSKESMLEWSEWKTDALIALTQDIMKEVHIWRPAAKSLRNIYPVVITEPESEEWFAQNYEKFLQNYDYTVIMAYPYLEGEYKNPAKWLSGLTRDALAQEGASEKIIMKIQTFDWRKNRKLREKEMFQHLSVLYSSGAKYFGFYPEVLLPEKSWPFAGKDTE